MPHFGAWCLIPGGCRSTLRGCRLPETLGLQRFLHGVAVERRMLSWYGTPPAGESGRPVASQPRVE
jgi:hypothetical protein